MQALSSVVNVIGLPCSICCQCRAEKPREIMSSWLSFERIRCDRSLAPSCRKNGLKSISSTVRRTRRAR